MNEELKIIISAEIDRLKDELQKGQKELKKTEETAKKSGSGIGKAMAAAGKAVAVGLKAAVAGVAALGAAVVGVAESTREFRTEQAMLKTAFEASGGSAELAKETYGELYSVLGDSGKATEAALHLAKLTSNEKALGQYTNILTGVYAKFGNSLPTEGLAEAINHSAQLGEVQGVLADALEWSGVSLDDFNTQLFMCNDEAEREALIRETLNGLYGEAGEAYKQNASDIIAANNAQLAMTEGLAACGAAVEPLITLFKVGLANALQGLIPGFEELTGGLLDVVNGVEGGQERMSGAIQAIVDSLLNTITNALPLVLQMGIDILTALITGITNALPTLLSAIVDMLPQVISTLGQLLPMVTGAILGSLPMLIEALFQVVSQILVELGNILPEIVMQIVEIVPMLVDAIVSNIPVLLDAAITFLMAIVEAIPTIIVELVNSLPGIIDTILDSLTENIPVLIEAAITLFMALVDAIPIIIPALVQAIPQIISSVIDFLLNNIPVLILGAVDFFMAIVEAIPIIVVELVKALPQILAAILVNLVEKTPAIFGSIWDTMVGVFQRIPEYYKNLFTGAVDIIKGCFTGIGNFFGGVWDGIKNAFGNISGWFKDSFSKAWQAVKDVFSKGGQVFDGIKDGILDGLKAVINFLIRGINTVIKIPFEGIKKALDAIRDVEILGVSPFSWMPTIGIPQIPELERGGVLEKGQVGLLEGNGAEAVVPLEKNTKWLDKLASMLSDKLSENDFNGTGGDQTIVLQVDGRTLARTSIKSINQLTKQTGKLDLLLV